MSAARAQELIEELFSLLAAPPRADWLHQDSADLPLPRSAYLRAAREAKFPTRREKRLVLVRRDDLERYLQSLPVQAARSWARPEAPALDAHRLADELRKPNSKARK